VGPFAGAHQKRPCREVLRKRGAWRRVSRKRARLVGAYEEAKASGKSGSSGLSRHAPATEGVRVTGIGVTNLGASNRIRGALGRRKSSRAPDQGSSAGQASKGAKSRKRQATREATLEGNLEGAERGSGDPGRARGSWRLQASAFDAPRRHAKACEEGSTPMPGALVGQQRRPLTRRRSRQVWCSSLEGRDRERQRLVADRPPGRIRHGEGAQLGGPSIESSQVRVALVPSESAERRDQAKARGSPSSGALPEVTSFVRFRPGGRPWKPSSQAKAEGEGDSGVERSRGCSYRRSVAEVG